MPDILFLPECYADTALVTMLLPPDAEIDHSFGVFNVIKAMKSAQIKRPSYKIVAIIDKDVTYKSKRRPPYFDEFIFTEAENKVSYGQKAETNEYLIMLDKAVDSFLLWNAQEVEIDVNTYGFQSDLRGFCKVMKRITIGADPQYRQLLTDLYVRQAPGFVTLGRILNDFLTTL